MPDATRAPGAASADTRTEVCALGDGSYARHPLDQIIEDAIDGWMSAPPDLGCEGAAVRAALADPQHRPLVRAWLAEVGLIGRAS